MNAILSIIFFAFNFKHRINEGLSNIVAGKGPQLTLAGMLVVFLGLIIMSLILTYIQNIIRFIDKITSTLKGKRAALPKHSPSKKKMSGEEAAAICLALILYQRMHMSDHREILTSRSELKMLSPWALSGKIHPTKKVK